MEAAAELCFDSQEALLASSAVRRLIESGWLALAGTLLGLGGAVALTRRLQALLFETSPMDPTVFATVSFLLAGIHNRLDSLGFWGGLESGMARRHLGHQRSNMQNNTQNRCIV